MTRLTTAALSVALIAGCAGASAQQSAQTTSAQAGGLDVGPPPATGDQSVDGEIATIADTAYAAEQDAAREALNKATNPEVRRFADHMLAANGEARREQGEIVQRLGVPRMPSPTSVRIAAERRQSLARLHAASGPDFDRAYMEAEKERLGALLDTIDREMLPNVRSVELRSFLEVMRAKISMRAMEADDVMRALR
jgi:putative membrane protein